MFLQNVRIPGLTIICAAGHYKETRYQAVLEAVINVTVSLALVWKLGITGVLIGTVCSYGYRSFDIILYNNKYLMKGSGKVSFLRIFRNLLAGGVMTGLGCFLVPQSMDSFLSWFLYAAGMGSASAVAIILVNYVAEPQEFKGLAERVRGILVRK